jgi:hypothetical protein
MPNNEGVVYICGMNGDICDCGPLLPASYMGAAVHMGMRWLAKQAPDYWTWKATEQLPDGTQKFIFRKGISQEDIRSDVSKLASRS